MLYIMYLGWHNAVMSCDIHTHAPAENNSTNILLYPFLRHVCSTDCLGHGHGDECHSPCYFHYIISSSVLHHGILHHVMIQIRSCLF